MTCQMATWRHISCNKYVDVIGSVVPLNSDHPQTLVSDFLSTLI
jgi:hypothetical protein